MFCHKSMYKLQIFGLFGSVLPVINFFWAPGAGIWHEGVADETLNSKPGKPNPSPLMRRRHAEKKHARPKIYYSRPKLGPTEGQR